MRFPHHFVGRNRLGFNYRSKRARHSRAGGNPGLIVVGTEHRSVQSGQRPLIFTDSSNRMTHLGHTIACHSLL